MKNQIATWFVRSWLFALAVIGVSCNDAFSPERKSELNTELSAQNNAEMVMATQDALDITSAGMVNQGITSGRVADGDGPEDEEETKDRLCGATVTKSVTMVNAMPDSLTITGIIIIDFGDGTQCADSSHRRSGSITTEFNITVNKLNHRAYHSVETVTLNEFTQGSKTLSGTFISKAAPGGLQWLKVQNAELNYADSVTITWNGDLTVTRDGGDTRSRNDDIKTITGSIIGTTPDGEFSSEITNDLIIKWECYRGRNIPVSGTIVVTSPEAVTTLDFGDGSCDKLYTSTTAGETKELHF
jgi:hypothetical protein